MAILQAVLKTGDGETVGLLVLTEKTFATGSRGFHGQGKLTIDGRKYQCQAQLVEIGSKAGVTDEHSNATDPARGTAAGG